MKRFLVILLALACSVPAFGQNPAHKTGARANHAKWAAAPKFDHRLRMAFSQPPESLGFVPQHLTYWGNDRYGSCVSSEAPPAAYAYRLMLNAAGYNIPEFTITDDALISWARAHGDLNGADLSDVMTDMGKDGIPDTNKILHLTGKFQAVDYTSQDAIKTAFANFGPLKIAIASNQLDGVVNGENGWVLTGARRSTACDHCVGILGFGRMDALAKLLGTTLPSGVDGSAFGVLMYTWSTVGIVDWPSLQGIMAAGECWARDPVDLPNGKPYPTPGPSPTPTPNWPLLTGALQDQSGIITGSLILTLPAGQVGGTWKYIIGRDASGHYSPTPQVFGSEAMAPMFSPAQEPEAKPSVESPKPSPKTTSATRSDTVPFAAACSIAG